MGQYLGLSTKSFGLPSNTNLKVIDLFMSDGKKVTREALEDKLQQQFSGLQVTENTHLRLIWLCPYICGFGEKHNGQKGVFPNTAPMLNRPPHTHPTTISLIKGIKKGSKHFLKSLNKVTDFLTAEHLSSWQKVMDDPSITKDDLRSAYKMAQKKNFQLKTEGYYPEIAY